MARGVEINKDLLDTLNKTDARRSLQGLRKAIQSSRQNVAALRTKLPFDIGDLTRTLEEVVTSALEVERSLKSLREVNKADLRVRFLTDFAIALDNEKRALSQRLNMELSRYADAGDSMTKATTRIVKRKPLQPAATTISRQSVGNRGTQGDINLNAALGSAPRIIYSRPSNPMTAYASSTVRSRGRTGVSQQSGGAGGDDKEYMRFSRQAFDKSFALDIRNSRRDQGYQESLARAQKDSSREITERLDKMIELLRKGAGAGAGNGGGGGSDWNLPDFDLPGGKDKKGRRGGRNRPRAGGRGRFGLGASLLKNGLAGLGGGLLSELIGLDDAGDNTGLGSTAGGLLGSLLGPAGTFAGAFAGNETEKYLRDVGAGRRVGMATIDRSKATEAQKKQLQDHVDSIKNLNAIGDLPGINPDDTPRNPTPPLQNTAQKAAQQNLQSAAPTLGAAMGASGLPGVVTKETTVDAKSGTIINIVTDKLGISGGDIKGVAGGMMATGGGSSSPFGGADGGIGNSGGGGGVYSGSGAGTAAILGNRTGKGTGTFTPTGTQAKATVSNAFGGSNTMSLPPEVAGAGVAGGGIANPFGFAGTAGTGSFGAGNMGSMSQLPGNVTTNTLVPGGSAVNAPYTGGFLAPETNPNVNQDVIKKYGEQGKRLPVVIRNNNPAALSLMNPGSGKEFAERQEGYVGATPRPANEGGYYAKYATPEHGVAANAKLLESYGNKGINTPDAIVRKWSVDTNAHAAYSKRLQDALGVSGSTPVDLNDKDIQAKILAAKSAHESGIGKPIYNEETFRKGVNREFPQPVPQGPGSLPGMVAGGSPGGPGTAANANTPSTGNYDPKDPRQFKTTDVIGADHPIWGMVDPKLAANKATILGGKDGRATGNVTAGSLLGADAVFRRATSEGVDMTVASGGGSNQHSRNHGAGTGVGEAIDIKPSKGWADGNQSQSYAETAAAAGANRLGVPFNGNGLHVQNSTGTASGMPTMSWNYGGPTDMNFRARLQRGDFSTPERKAEIDKLYPARMNPNAVAAVTPSGMPVPLYNPDATFGKPFGEFKPGPTKENNTSTEVTLDQLDADIPRPSVAGEYDAMGNYMGGATADSETAKQAKTGPYDFSNSNMISPGQGRFGFQAALNPKEAPTQADVGPYSFGKSGSVSPGDGIFNKPLTPRTLTDTIATVVKATGEYLATPRATLGQFNPADPNMLSKGPATPTNLNEKDALAKAKDTSVWTKPPNAWTDPPAKPGTWVNPPAKTPSAPWVDPPAKAASTPWVDPPFKSNAAASSSEDYNAATASSKEGGQRMSAAPPVEAPDAPAAAPAAPAESTATSETSKLAPVGGGPLEEIDLIPSKHSDMGLSILNAKDLTQ